MRLWGGGSKGQKVRLWKLNQDAKVLIEPADFHGDWNCCIGSG